jgi:hypothetical protein
MIALLLVLLLASRGVTAIYPKDLFEFSTYLRPDMMERHIESEILAGRTVIVRIIASPT